MKRSGRNIGHKSEIATTSTKSNACREAISEVPKYSRLKAALLAALKLAQPQIAKEYLYERCISKYVDAMIPAISAAIANSQHVAEFAFCQSAIREVIGTIGKKQQYIYQLMKEDARTSLLLVIRKGFKDRKSTRLNSSHIPLSRMPSSA